jgi:fructokinase
VTFSYREEQEFGTLPFAGVELGGTKCICTLAFGPGQILEQRTVETTDPAETLGRLQSILRKWWVDQGFRALGIASFGPICLDRASPDYGHILATNKPGWSGANVLGDLSGWFPVACGFDTDVNAAALAEMAWGSGHGLNDFAYITVGTGIGVGLIVNGRPTRGLLHGELGHMVVPRNSGDSFPSVCAFHQNCAEGLASGSALKARLGAEALSDTAPDHPVWELVVSVLAALCHNMVCTTGPQRIACGGGVLNRQPHLLPRIEARLRESLAGYMLVPEGRPYIVEPTLGGQAGPLGAIILGVEAEAAAALGAPTHAVE